MLLRLPDSPFQRVPRGLLATIADQPARFAEPATRLLSLIRGSEVPPHAGYRGAYLVALVGHWRFQPALTTLVDWLGTPWGFGGAEVVLALTRLGAPAVEDLLFSLFGSGRPPIERQRAARALASVGVAAMDYGADPLWRWDADACRAEVAAALRLLLERGPGEHPDVVREAAEGLCHLRFRPAWSDIERLFAAGIVADTEDFGVRLARALMTGAAYDFRMGAFKAPMLPP